MVECWNCTKTPSDDNICRKCYGLPVPKLTVEEAKKTIGYSIEHGEGQYVLNESYPFTTEYTLNVCKNAPPNFNIDWDTRNDISGNIIACGSFDFNTVEEGAALFSKEVESVPDYAWKSEKEKENLEREIQNFFKKFYDNHCTDEGDCPYKETCQVRWPGGFGLQGCKANDDKKLEIYEEVKKFWD